MLWKSGLIGIILVFTNTTASWSAPVEAENPARRPGLTTSVITQLEATLKLAIEEERFPEAEKVARQILGQDPKNRMAILSLARALERQKKIQPAESLYRQHIAQYPLDFLFYLELGQLLTEQGQKLEALAAHPANAYVDIYEIHQNFESLLSDLGRIEEAIAFCRQRLAVSENRIEIFNLGLRLSSMLKAQGKAEESIAVIRNMMAKQPGEIHFYLQLAQELSESGNSAALIEIYQRAIAFAQEDLPTDHYNSIYLSLGKLLENQQQFSEALVVYRKLLARQMPLRNPEDDRNIIQQAIQGGAELLVNSPKLATISPLFGAQLAIDKLLYKQQGWAAVQKEMQPIEQTTPRLAAYVFQLLGDQLIAQAKYSDALLSYQQALKLDEKREGIHGNLFLAWTFLDRPPLARASYQKALSLTPASQRPKFLKKWAFALDRGRRWPEAIALYRQILKSLDPERLTILLQLAKALEQNGTSAAEIYQQSAKLLQGLQRSAPQDPQTRSLQGDFHYQRQDYGLAIDSYREAIRLFRQSRQSPRDELLPISQLKLADSLRLMNRQAEAIDLYRQAMQYSNYEIIKASQPSTLHAMAYHGMGLSLEQQGKIPEARAAFDRSLDLDANYLDAQNSQMRLRNKPGTGQ
jgi:tetratricopeptide (TPR) repeat protein